MEIERAKAIQQSSNWDEVCKELDVWINLQLQQTKSCLPDRLEGIQAKIRAYEEVKSLPQTVIERDE